MRNIWRVGRGLVTALLALALVASAQTAGVAIKQGRVERKGDLYYLDLAIALRLSEPARRALESGVPLVLRVDVEVERVREWWWDEQVVSHARRFRLSYHALSERYLLTALGTGESRSFRTLGALLRELRELRRLGVIAVQRVSPGERYRVWAQVGLDLDALPRPLRTIAYVSPAWRLASEWRTWSLDS